jgi:electron-transferring-flavoprotein dehydrogenase
MLSSSVAGLLVYPPPFRLKQLAAAKGAEVSVVVLEKGSEPGAHILSGAIMDPDCAERADTELERTGRTAEPAGDRRCLYFLKRAKRVIACPTIFATLLQTTTATTSCEPGRSHQSGWANKPKPLGVEIFPGFHRR